MRKGLFYYSQTGNTELLCRKIQSEFPEFELIDIRKAEGEKPSAFDLAGFACHTWNLDLPVFFKRYIESMPEVQNVPAFILISFSVMEGRAVKNAGILLKDRGFRIFDYHSIKMPDSFPPFRKKGIENENYPDDKELLTLNGFLDRLGESDQLREKRIKPGFWNTVIKGPGIDKIKKDFGSLKADPEKCSHCGFCSANCDYESIQCSPEPQFHMDSCMACYSCLNNCPEGAIYTDSVEPEFAYKGPSELLKKKFAS